MAAIDETPFGRLEKPTLLPDAGIRVDFDAPEFDRAITNHGYRMIWTRRADCPCAPLSYQLTQPDPNCTLCSGTGYLYFGPQQPQDLSAHTFSPVQQAALTTSGGFLIYALAMPLSSQDKRNDRLGSWLTGGSSITVMADNQLGFRDKLVNIDSRLPYTEVGLMPARPSLTLPLRYLISGAVYLCMDETGKRYTPDVDFSVDVGLLAFSDVSAPSPGTRVSVFYITFPVWVVENTSHRSRVQNSVTSDGQVVSPEGSLQQLPIQAQVSLEFIPSDLNGGGG